jgi:hypothetical protein
MSTTLTIELASAIATSRATEAHRAVAASHLAAARKRRRKAEAIARRISLTRLAMP